jgi:amino acid adenylation domain-containing protein
MFELTAPQEIVWLHEQVTPESRAYTFTGTLDLRGLLHERYLYQALNQVIERHDVLRLELVERPGQLPAQRVLPVAKARCRTVDLSADPDPEVAFTELLRAEAVTPIDTAHAPLLRWTLVRLSDTRHRLIHIEHHLIHDGHSLAILLHDIFTIYRAAVLGVPADLPPARSYAHYIEESAGPEAALRRKAGLAYWKNELADATFDLPLPGLGQPRIERRNAGAQLRQTIPASLAERLRKDSAGWGHTPYTTLLALFAELMRRHSGRTEVVIGTGVANRPAGFERTVGMFVNTLALRLRPNPAATATELVDDVTDTVVRALQHHTTQVQELTRALGMHTSGLDNPLFTVMFSAHDVELPELDLPGLEVSLFEGFNTGTTRFDLDVVLLPDDRRTVTARGGAAGMTLVWDYDRDVFSPAALTALSERLIGLLTAYLDDPGRSLADLAVPTVEPLAAVTGRRPVDRVLDPLRQHPADRTALLGPAETLTYGDLDRMVEAQSHALLSVGVRPGQPVAVVLPTGVESIVALLACLRMHAAYCPLSTRDPGTRTRMLVDRLGPAMVLTAADNFAELSQALLGSGVPIGVVGAELPPAAGARVIDGVAYVVHTSGSTGLPKPVVIGRPALAQHIDAVSGRFELTGDDVALLFAQPAFDVALQEVLPTLLAGARLVDPGREIATAAEVVEVSARHGVTIANLPTSYVLAEREVLRESFSTGQWAPRLLVIGGERVPADALRMLLSGTTITSVNTYGATESAVDTTHHYVRAEQLGDGPEVPLGSGHPGNDVLVLDEMLQPLPDGAVGQLVLIGDGLGDGYLDNPEETAARFVPIPAIGGWRGYLTGDLGFRDLQHDLYFLGRRDHQIKLRGHRIELEEIETVASRELDGRPCVVLLDDSPPTGPALVGFVETARIPGHDELRSMLSQRLPDALVPTRWVRLDRFPTTSSGKPDRRALAELRTEELPPPAPQPAAADPMQQLLAEAWREVLKHDRFTAASHFFEVGGHSLLVARLAAWLSARLGQRVRLRVLLQHPVLADQALALRQDTATIEATNGERS